MCGIAGYLGLNPPSERKLQEVGNTLIHRGPDGSGVFRFVASSGVGVGLVHRRLAIIDFESRSNQPFRLGDGVLVYNGEIYNYLEVRQQLQDLGHSFKTRGDTEVLAVALQQWGKDCLERLEGMWAFAWYKEADQSLLLSRDRFGEKPLYIHRTSECIYFASEPKAIFCLLERKLPVNYTQVKRYLVNGYKSLYKTRDTFFEGLEEVLPGHVVQAGHKFYESSRYWSPNFNCQNPSMTFSDAVENTKNLLVSSIRIRLRSDAPIAFLLSGGVDSNALVSIAHKILNHDSHAFTIIHSDSRYEEREVVDAAVNNLGIRHTQVPLSSKGFLSNLRRQIIGHDAPIYTITYYVQWLLMQEIHKNNYKVAISGTGADELFSGYYDHHLAYLADVSKSAPFAYQSSLQNWEREIRPWVRNPYLTNPSYFIDEPEARDHIFLDSSKFSALLNEYFFEKFSEERYSDQLLRNRMLNELFHETVPVILHEDDLNSMHCSIENRSPFLDRKLFEFTNRIPTINLINRGRAKAVLREALRGIAPALILDNPVKIGFNASILELLDTTDKRVVDEVLSDSPVFDIVNRAGVTKLLKGSRFPNSESKFLFNFLCSKLFLEEFS